MLGCFPMLASVFGHKLGVATKTRSYKELNSQKKPMFNYKSRVKLAPTRRCRSDKMFTSLLSVSQLPLNKVQKVVSAQATFSARITGRFPINVSIPAIIRSYDTISKSTFCASRKRYPLGVDRNRFHWRPVRLECCARPNTLHGSD